MLDEGPGNGEGRRLVHLRRHLFGQPVIALLGLVQRDGQGGPLVAHPGRIVVERLDRVRNRLQQRRLAGG